MTLQELFSDKTKWIKGTWAVKNGVPIKGSHPTIECDSYCLLGAIRACYPNDYEIVKKIEEYIDCEITVWNDSYRTTFQDIRKLVEDLNI